MLAKAEARFHPHPLGPLGTWEVIAEEVEPQGHTCASAPEFVRHHFSRRRSFRACRKDQHMGVTLAGAAVAAVAEKDLVVAD
jgi:hypothetical protein